MSRRAPRAGHPGSQPSHSLPLPRAPIPVAVALAVLAVLATVAPEPAAAQTVTTFISNTGQTANRPVSSVRATAFTTGTGTYTLSSVGIVVGTQGGSPTPVVKIYGDTSGNPGTLLATMTNPGTITEEAVNVFTAPANTMLSASTPYWVVTSNSAATNGQGFRVRVIPNTNLDSGTAAGWSIGNARWKNNIANTSWSTSSSRIRFEIRGTGGTTTNNPPTVATAIPDQTATAGTAFSYAFPDTTFSDADTGDTLTYTATKADDTALPTWLAFAAGTRTFSGTPQAADAGTVSVEVTASDGNGGSVSDAFDITVIISVPSNWTLKPTALAAGARFRLLFLSSTRRNASSTDIATYNTFIQTRAAAGHTDIRAYSASFRVVGCTAAVDARDNTKTTYTTTDKGVPIYWLNGAKAADQYEDFYDGSWDDEANDKNESGTNGPDTSQAGNYPLTGCDHDGTEGFNFDNMSVGLGASVGSAVGRPNSSAINTGPINGNTGAVAGDTRPLYGLSAVFQVAADTTPPTLTSADVEITDALIINLVFSEDLQLSNPPAVSAFTVTVDGSAATVSSVLVPGSVLPQNELWLQLSTAIRQGQAVVVTYTDATSGDDTAAIQDTAGNDAATFTTGMDGVPAVTNNSTVTNTVPADWSLIPTGLSTGDKFQLLFLSSTKRNASSTDIADYNTFIQTRAAAGHADIRDYSADFRAVGCTADTDARDNTKTTYTTTDKGVPIYWLNGAKAADQYEDFYDGSWDDEANDKNESGTNGPDTSLRVNYPWTGCDHDGTEAVTGGDSFALGTNLVDARVGRPNSSVSNVGPLNGQTNRSNFENSPLYGLSEVFQVAAAVVVPNNPPTVATAIPDQSATAGTAFSYAFPANTFSDADTGDTLSYTATKADGTALPTWLAFTAGTRTFSGTPQAADTGTVSVKVTASDGNGGSVSDTFDITVAADTTPPTLSSAFGSRAGTQILFVFSENLQGSNVPPASAFTVTAGGNTVTVGNVSAIGEILAIGVSPLIRHGQAVVATYTDPTTGDDTAAIQDTAGNDTATFTTGMNSVPDVLNTSTVTNTPATGAPTITGTAQVGQTLTAGTTAIMDADGLTTPSYTYQWIRVATDNTETNIASATASTYTLVAADQGTTIKVTVSFTDDASNDETLTSNVSVIIARPANTAATGKPGITGTAQVGQTLTATVGTSADVDGLPNPFLTDANTSFQWIRVATDNTETNIASATASTYTLVTDDAGTTIKVKVGFADNYDYDEMLTSDATAAVSAAANTPATGAPTITGTAQVGQTLTATVGTIADANGLPDPFLTDANTSFQWIRVATDNTETNIASATASTYTLVTDDAGTTIKVKVGFADNYDYDEMLTSDATAAVSAAANTPATGAPTITGTAQVGQTLTAGTTAIMDADGLTTPSYTYQWIRVATDNSDTNIASATASTYTLVDADLGTTVKVKVSFTDDASNPETLTSAATAVVTDTTGQTTVTFGASSYTATEGGAATTVTVALSAAPSASVTIPLTKTHRGGATAADYSGVPSNVTFTAGQTRRTFTVTATDDADKDGGESVQLGFGTLPAGYAPGARRTATVTLVDDDANLIVNFGTERHTTVKVRESDTVWHRFIFSLSTSRYGPPNGNPQQPVTIPLVVTHRGGTTTEDYEGIPSSVTFGVGESVTSFRMRAIPDGRRETGEGLRLDFGRLPAGVRQGDWGPYETIAFVDQVLPGYTVLFGAESYTATEGGAPARVSIHLSEPVEIEPLVVRLVVTHVGATAADYTGIPKSVRFGVGEQTQTITVKATDDTDDDDDESVTLSFVNDPNGRVRVRTGPASATVALADNDGPRRVTVSFGAVTYTATEGGADATVRVELDAAPGRSVTVPLTKAHLGNATAADYSGIPMNVTFAANQTSRTFAVMATAGDGSDGGESVSIGFGTLPEGVFAGSPAATTVTLADGAEQRLVVNFGSSRGHTVQVREGARRLRLNVLLDSSPRRPVTIPLVVTHVGGATEADYAAIPESVTFAAGQTSAHYYVRALPDEEDETGEGLQLDFGPLPPGVRKGTWGPYETIDFLDPAPAANLLSVSRTVVTMGFPWALDGGSTPSPRDFVVSVEAPGGEKAMAPVAAVAVEGSDVFLQLARPVAPDDTVTLSYLADAMHPIRDEAGSPAAPLTDAPVRNQTPASGLLPFSVPDRGGFSVTSQDAEPMLRVGYGQVETDAGMTPPAGLAIFGSRLNGILVSEAGVPAVPPVLEGRIFAETEGLSAPVSP